MQEAIRRAMIPADSSFATEVGELIQPTVNILDLDSSPLLDFGRPLMGSKNITAVAGEFPVAVLQPAPSSGIVAQMLGFTCFNPTATPVTVAFRIISAVQLAAAGLTPSGSLLYSGNPVGVPSLSQVLWFQGTHTAILGSAYLSVRVPAENNITIEIPRGGCWLLGDESPACWAFWGGSGLALESIGVFAREWAPPV